MAAARKPASRATATRARSARPTNRAKTIPAAAAAAPIAIEPPPAEPPRKIKILRDSFRIPTNEYEVIDALKKRAAKAGRPARKSDVLRAGVKVLAALGDLAFVTALAAVPPMKRERPSKS